jgi:hypothetical protein
VFFDRFLPRLLPQLLPGPRVPYPAAPASPPACPSGGRPAAWLPGLCARLAARWQPPERVLRVEELLMVGGKKSVLLLACGGRRYLLASSGDAIAPLLEVLPLDMPLAAGGGPEAGSAQAVPGGSR